jgi:hypothetical protein
MIELQSAQNNSTFCNTKSGPAAYTALPLTSSVRYSYSALQVVHSEKSYDKGKHYTKQTFPNN